MAEYCKKCAEKFGFERESYPLFCEGCNQFFYNQNLIKKIFLILKTKISWMKFY